MTSNSSPTDSEEDLFFAVSIDAAAHVATIEAPSFAPLSCADIRFAAALRDTVRDLADNDDVKVIVIRATGGHFAAPVAQNELAAAARIRRLRQAPWHAAFAASSGLYQTLAFCKKFVITEVSGQCAGAGTMLVLASDLTVCADDSTFESPFGAIPEANLVLSALTVRLNRAKSWVLSGERWTAVQADAAGLVNRAVPAHALARTTADMSHAAALMPLDGIAMTKILLEAYLDTQGVGQEFDMAGLYATAMDRHWAAWADASARTL